MDTSVCSDRVIQCLHSRVSMISISVALDTTCEKAEWIMTYGECGRGSKHVCLAPLSTDATRAGDDRTQIVEDVKSDGPAPSMVSWKITMPCHICFMEHADMRECPCQGFFCFQEKGRLQALMMLLAIISCLRIRKALTVFQRRE